MSWWSQVRERRSSERWACPSRSGSIPHKPETVTGWMLADGLRPSEVVHQTIPDPAEQAPLVARSVTPPSPSGRGGTTLLRQRAPRSCTVFVMTPPNEHTSEGGRDDRGVPYHAESTLSQCNGVVPVVSRGGRLVTEVRLQRQPPPHVVIVVHNDIPTTTIDARTQAHTKLGHSNGQTARLRLIG